MNLRLKEELLSVFVFIEFMLFEEKSWKNLRCEFHAKQKGKLLTLTLFQKRADLMHTSIDISFFLAGPHLPFIGCVHCPSTT